VAFSTSSRPIRLRLRRSVMKTKDIFKEMLKSIDLKESLRKMVYGGFDTFEDYVKYGDAFVKIDRKKFEEKL
jgi:hypothetical protein